MRCRRESMRSRMEGGLLLALALIVSLVVAAQPGVAAPGRTDAPQATEGDPNDPDFG